MLPNKQMIYTCRYISHPTDGSSVCVKAIIKNLIFLICNSIYEYSSCELFSKNSDYQRIEIKKSKNKLQNKIK